MTVNFNSNGLGSNGGCLKTIPILQSFMDLNVEKLFNSILSTNMEILQYFLEHPNQNAYCYSKSCGHKPSSTGERKAYRNITSLFKNRFIDIVDDTHFDYQIEDNKIPKKYRLSMTGIFYLILTTKGISNNLHLIQKLCKNYEANTLFSFFLYSIVQPKTIKKIPYDVQFFSIVVEYLKNVCKLIIEIVQSINKYTNNLSSPVYGISPVFVYNDNQRDSNLGDMDNNIRFFLSHYLNWNDVDSLKIEPIYDERVIKITDGSDLSRNATIKILERENRAIFRKGSEIIYQFFVERIENAVIVQTKTPIDIFNEAARLFCERYETHKINFLVNLRTQMVNSTNDLSNPTYDDLEKDRRYKKALRWLKRKQNFN